MIPPLCAVAIGGLLVYVVIDDLRAYRIRNLVVGALLALSLLSIWLDRGLAGLVPHLAFGLLAFAAMLLAYSRGLMGGGDTKLLSVAFLAMGPQSAMPFSLALLLFTMLYWAGARLSLLPSQSIGGRMKIPFGPSIAVAWFVTMMGSEWLARSYLEFGMR